MAIDDSLARETDSLILPNKTFYPIRIDIGHWQLRHYISSPSPHFIYYVAKEHVFSFDLNTNTRNYLCPLPYPARCTASGFGYILVGGGDHGNFAIVKLDGTPSFAAEVDALLPVELSSRSNRAQTPPAPSVKYEKLGTDIVNSISIHKLENHEEQDVRDDVVAVLTNNDKSVRIYSLTQDKEIASMELRFSANHATISPDGQMLVAVGDYQEAYFYERVNVESSKVKVGLTKYAGSLCNWELHSVASLHVLKPALIAGYFSTAWSHNGNLCAVGSECGFITVFDVRLLKVLEDAEDAIVAVIPSSRPDAAPQTGAPGAVRTMMFSPAPWDLLIWAEDQGRVCVADLRTGLRTRQVLRLDPAEAGLRKVEIGSTTYSTNDDILDVDRIRADDQINRYRLRGTDYNMIPGALNEDRTGYLEFAAERRRIQRLANALVADDDGLTASLTAQERQILDALRTRGSREEQSRPPIRSIYYGEPDSSVQRQATLSPTASNTADFPALTRSTAAGSSDSLSHQLSIVRDYLRPRQDSRSSRTADQFLRDNSSSSTQRIFSSLANTTDRLESMLAAHSPTSQPMQSTSSSTLLASSAPNTSATTTTSSNPHASRHPPLPPHIHRTGLPRILPPPNGLPNTSANSSTTPALHALASSSMAGRNSPPPPLAPQNPDLVELRRRRQLQRARERVSLTRERGPMGPYEQSLLLTRRHMTTQPDPSCGPQTAGLAMSPDGRWLYAAAECGVWCFEVDLWGRRGWGALKMR